MRINHFRRVAAAVAAVVALPVLAAPALAVPEQVPGVRISISEVELDGPTIAEVVVTVDNNSEERLQKTSVDFAGPVGWTVHPTPQVVKGAVQPGQRVDLSYDIRVPAPTAGVSIRTFTATAHFDVRGKAHTASGSRTQIVGEPLENLAAAYNNVGVTDDSDPAPGNFDGDGNSFSAQALADVGVTPGSAVHALGASFTWPDVPSGTENNVRTAGQMINLSGQGDRLAFLGSAAPPGTGSVTVLYADGSSETGTIGFPGWCCVLGETYGSEIAVETDYRNTPSGPANHAYTYRLFANSIDIDEAKTVEHVVLPANSALHVFDMVLVG